MSKGPHILTIHPTIPKAMLYKQSFSRQALICIFPLSAIPSGCFTTAVCGYIEPDRETEPGYLATRKAGKRDRSYFQFLKLGHHTAAQTAAPAQLRRCTGTEMSGCARELF